MRSRWRLSLSGPPKALTKIPFIQAFDIFQLMFKVIIQKENGWVIIRVLLRVNKILIFSIFKIELNWKNSICLQIKRSNRLFLVTSGSPPASGFLKFPALRSDIRPGMAAGHAWGTKVSVGGSLVPWSLEKNGVGTSRGLLSELVEGDDLTASF